MINNVICTTCNTAFHKKPSRIKENNFCSSECYFKYKRRNQIVTKCEHGDIRNNNSENLMVLKSQADHLEWHRLYDPRYGGEQFHV